MSSQDVALKAQGHITVTHNPRMPGDTDTGLTAVDVLDLFKGFPGLNYTSEVVTDNTKNVRIWNSVNFETTNWPAFFAMLGSLDLNPGCEITVKTKMPKIYLIEVSSDVFLMRTATKYHDHLYMTYVDTSSIHLNENGD
jgi:hypothetical protein